MQVNKTPATRAGILSILRASPVPVSGESMAQALGKTRVAVWKAIQSLNAAGYGIVAGNDGYTLLRDIQDSLETWEFDANAGPMFHFSITDSTMEHARDQALAGAEVGTVVTADSQRSGRGTDGKNWASPSGGLFFTLITRPSLNLAYNHLPVLAAQCALARASARLTRNPLLPVWPNDLFILSPEDRGKAGGILPEILSSGSEIRFENLGIGINTRSKPDEPNASAIDVSRHALLAAFLSEFTDEVFSPREVMAEWNALCPEVGKPIEYCRKGRAETLHGTFLGVDARGWANIADAKETEAFPPGSIITIRKGMNQ